MLRQNEWIVTFCRLLVELGLSQRFDFWQPESEFAFSWEYLLDKRTTSDPEWNCYRSLAVVWGIATVPTLSLSLLHLHKYICALWMNPEVVPWGGNLRSKYLTTWNVRFVDLALEFHLLWKCAWSWLERRTHPDVFYWKAQRTNRKLLWSLTLPWNYVPDNCNWLWCFDNPW